MEGIILLFLVILLGAVVFFNRNKFTFYGKFPYAYFGMYKTKLGISSMDQLVKKYPRLIRIIGEVGIVFGFIGMIIVCFDVVKTLYKIIFTNYLGVSVGLVLPIKANGVFYVPLTYWLITLAFLAVVHEFGHGLIARLYKIKLKSTGFAFLGILIPLLPAAFVEPDEKKLAKKKIKEQLAVFAAGPFVNIVFGLLFMLLFFQVMQPATAELYNYEGMQITSLFSGNNPAKNAGLQIGEVIKEINGEKIRTVSEFKEKFKDKKEGDILKLMTSESVKEITLAKDGMMGVFVEEKKELINKNLINQIFVWLKDLVYWLFVLNLGVGLFNLLPIGPIDGGRMLEVVLQKIMPHKHARRVWYGVSAVFLVGILGSVFVSFL